MTPYQYNDTYFRATFPVFSDQLKYPEEVLSGYWDLAESGFLPSIDQYILNGKPLVTALNLMTAHLAQWFSVVNDGQQNLILTGAVEGTVNISDIPPPFSTGYQYWLCSTQYGQQLWALLQIQSMGGILVGYSGELCNFRRANGYFGCQ